MKLLCALLASIPAVCAAYNLQVDDKRPTDFVNLNTIPPEIQYDFRYFTGHNFVGRRTERSILHFSNPLELADCRSVAAVPG